MSDKKEEEIPSVDTPKVKVETKVDVLSSDSKKSSNDPVPSSSGAQLKGKHHKRKSKKSSKKDKNKDASAPKQPLTGYLRFLSDKRDQVRQDNPQLGNIEVTKLLAAEWSGLPPDKKQHYLDAAEQDRERYLQEMAVYKQSDAYKAFKENQTKIKNKEEEEDNLKNSVPQITDPTISVSIFTDEFIELNKHRETELKNLCKEKADLEQENAMLKTSIDGMQKTTRKLIIETDVQKRTNAALKNHLEHLQKTFTSALSHTQPIPGFDKPPTLENIDKYVETLNDFLKKEPKHAIRTTLRKTVKNLKFKKN